MRFNLKLTTQINVAKLKTECLIIGTNTLQQLSLPAITAKYITKIIKQEKFNESINLNKTMLLFDVPGILASRLLLINTNKSKEYTEIEFLDLIKNISVNLTKSSIGNAMLWLENFVVTGKDLAWQVYQLSFNLTNNLYQFDLYKSKKSLKVMMQQLDFIIDKKWFARATAIIKQVTAVNNACRLVKDLANTPPNVCTTNFIAATALKFKQKSAKIKVNILEKKDLHKLNMGAFLAVAQGSLQPPKLICIEYNGSKRSSATKKSPIVFIGKGITFDTGGNSLKPANAMVGMKFDMCGAATVLGLIDFAIAMQLNINLVGIIATAENMPGRHASRPDDVVTTMSGMTVEILNTDAEGRLVLCEALTYCNKFNPKTVIDIATLTGSCAATFGHAYTGLFSNNQELAQQLLHSGEQVYDKAWQLPITAEYHKFLESDIADLANVGGSYAGSITAACFLAKFAEKYKWAHLDIAGTAYYQEGKITRLPSARSLPLLAQYLLNVESLP